MEIIRKICKKCKKLRKFIKDTERDKQNICGNCWDWEADNKEYRRRMGIKE